MVNIINRRIAITKAPEPGRLNGVWPCAPRGQVGMLNDYIDPGQTFIACRADRCIRGLVPTNTRTYAMTCAQNCVETV
jgi:hypothetical protein